METALSTARRGWDDGPGGRASDWIRQPGRALKVLADLESTADGGAAFSRVWEGFGWAHSPASEQGAEAPQRDIPTEAARVLALLLRLPEATARQAINGIAHWLSAWEKQVVILPEGLIVWLKLWPIAVEVTNTQKPAKDEIALNTVSRPSDDREPMDLDTLNTSTGKLVGVFLAACPTVRPGDQPFQENNGQTQMRTAIESSFGTSGLIVRYRLVEELAYFFKADLDWTSEYLIPPLLVDDEDSLVLWRAVARRTRFFEELKLLGDAMVDRATDGRLGRTTRRSLVFSLVVECLQALLERRDPAVPHARIQQMIRSLDDEVRADAAEAIQRFVGDVRAPAGGLPSPSPEDLFRSAAAPFLRQVWPQERSLSTPGVSRALADLPATARGEFAEAVDAIERFLLPFDCWSMLEYGFYGKADGEAKLSNIDNPKKVAALLRLLDRTIGTAETSVIPHDLGDAIDQVRKVAPNLAETQVFRRLATAARRA